MNLKKLRTGVILLRIFLCSIFAELLFLIAFIRDENKNLLVGLSFFAVLAVVKLALFCVGLFLVYTTSIQLGIIKRFYVLILAWIPIVNLFLLVMVIRICSEEYHFESSIIARDKEREGRNICQTRYPIVMVHGVFFRDFEHLNYWGRIPAELKKNGATLFYGKHNSANAVRDSAIELEARIKEIIAETGCEKVNIIAHSKGGLDARAMIQRNPSLVASLTTISTPHRGCEFADYFFNKVSDEQKLAIAAKYNKMASAIGDVNPDFISAVRDLTASECEKINEEIPDAPNVFYQSYGSVLQSATSGAFPINFTYHLVQYFDGPNDGLVGTNSFPWGSEYTLLANAKSTRGISHADVIDLNRENIRGFDVREFYVQLVANLRERGF